MTKGQRAKKVSELMNTSIEDCRITLQGYHDSGLLCDLLIQCNRACHESREQVVRRRIAALIPKRHSNY
jgi:hypothetical protein